MDKQGRRRDYESVYLRRTFRDGDKVRNETVANLSMLPEAAITALEATLKVRPKSRPAMSSPSPGRCRMGMWPRCRRWRIGLGFPLSWARRARRGISCWR